MTVELTPARFVTKWSRSKLPERAASQEHFIDLCRLLGQPTPAEHDATGAEYTFEKGVKKLTGPASAGSKGDGGFADVWWRSKFAWEYKRKGKYKNLAEAYRQVCQYREALENPPLLVVCDIAQTEIHTNFTGTKKVVHCIPLAELDQPENLDKLRRVFTDPESFKPTLTTEQVTQQVAEQIGKIALGLGDRGHDPHDAAHFLMKCMFCLFAEDVGLLPKDLFKTLLERGQRDPARLTPLLTDLFAKMRSGGDFGADEIAHFNGGLFDGTDALELDEAEVVSMHAAAEQDWSAVEPAIFGTLFERSLDPSKRAQIGAHYTSRDDIMLVIEPVIMRPLRREWAAVQADVAEQIDRRRKVKTTATKRKVNETIRKRIMGFQEQLATVRILDPACGSGNFLYVAIQQLLDLEKEVITFAAGGEIGEGLLPQVRPTQLHGIEINTYAAELAQVVIWIGYLQWMRDNGFNVPRDPILEPLQTIECRDAILDRVAQPPPAGIDANAAQPPPAGTNAQAPQSRATVPHEQIEARPAGWPEADFIVGNPPFLGSKVFRQNGLPDAYINAMYESFDLPNTSDLCCYWFELARRAIEQKPHTRCGLLATQGIRGGANRTVLERIKHTADIFMAWSDREWILDGAAVHVSIVGFCGLSAKEPRLDGRPVTRIYANLVGDVHTTSAVELDENKGKSFIGGMKKGKFDLNWESARCLLARGGNPNGRSNADVLSRWVNGLDITRRKRGEWIIDFGAEQLEIDAAQYEAPFERVVAVVKPARDKVRTGFERELWWRHARPVPELRAKLALLPRFIGTARVAKHRLFVFLDGEGLPDGQIVVFARSDDYFFGVLHSSIHELWALRQGTQLEDRPRYTPTTCFETFPLPWPPGSEPLNVAQPPPAGRNADVARTDADVAQPPSAGMNPQDPQPRATVPPEDVQGSRATVPPVDEAKPAKAHYRRNLPHIQPGCRPVFVTFCTHQRWELPPSVRDLVVKHCLHDNGSKLWMHGLVVMPDHVHLIFTPLLDKHGSPYGLSEIMSGIKGASAHSINKALHRKGSVWQDESFDHILRRNESLEQKVAYICHNPVRKGLARNEDEYRWLWREWIDGPAIVAQPPPAGTNAIVAQPPSAGIDAQGPQSRATVLHGSYLHQRIAEAAAELNEQRERWLNPPEWIAPLAAQIDAQDDFADVARVSGEEARRLIRQSAIDAAAAKDPQLKKRTLTNLYNERPTWLRLAHEKLDRAVLAAYAAVDPAGEWAEDWAEVWTDTGAGQPLPDGHELAERRSEIDQLVLANLLRLNLSRA
ncbi:MAG: hypothetical protein GY842_18620 [bacterium]|nr:hypothetical protein [bacterium]